MKLNSLLCADHLIILSRSKVGLQNCLNTLSSYFNSLMLKINPKNTRKIIFQKCKKKGTLASTLPMKNSTLSKTCTSPSGNLTLSLDHLRQKTLMPSLRRNTDFKSVKSSLACSSEVWRTFVQSDFKSWDNSSIEKAHLQFFQKLINEFNNLSRPLKSVTCSCCKRLGASDFSPRGERTWLCFASLIFFI